MNPIKAEAVPPIIFTKDSAEEAPRFLLASDMPPALKEIVERQTAAPENAGRHSTGQAFTREEIEKIESIQKRLPACEDPDSIIIPKRVALSVAMELLKGKKPIKAQGYVDGGRCVIEALFDRGKRTMWAGRTWFLALHSLRQSLQTLE